MQIFLIVNLPYQKETKNTLNTQVTVNNTIQEVENEGGAKQRLHKRTNKKESSKLEDIGGCQNPAKLETVEMIAGRRKEIKRQIYPQIWSIEEGG